MVSVVQEPIVNFVGKHRDVVLLRQICQLLQILFCDDAAAGVVRRIYNHQSCAVGYLGSYFVDVDAELPRLVEPHRHRNAAHKLDHRLINRESRVWVQNLVALIHERHDREEHNWLAAGSDHNLIAGHRNSSGRRYFFSDSVSEVVEPRRRVVMGKPIV